MKYPIEADAVMSPEEQAAAAEDAAANIAVKMDPKFGAGRGFPPFGKPEGYDDGDETPL